MDLTQYRAHRGRYTIVLLGREDQLKEEIIRLISASDLNAPVPSDRMVVESPRVVSTPDIFDINNMYKDQHIIDCMAQSLPGPHIFILAVDQDNAQANKIVSQLATLQIIFGDVHQNLIVVLPDMESCLSLSHLTKQFNITLTICNEGMATVCRDWCAKVKPFTYNYNNYSEAVVMRRRNFLSRLRRDDPPVHDGAASVMLTQNSNTCRPSSPTPAPKCGHPVTGGEGSTTITGPRHYSESPAVCSSSGAPKHRPVDSLQPMMARLLFGESSETILDTPFFNIILMGLTGTGKSASANTILSAAKSKTRFCSTANSEPTTVKCQFETVAHFGTQLTVVDTPDFFHENIANVQEQLQLCKKYFVPGHYVVLLVVKVNRFTDEERDILQKLECKLEMIIRNNTILLLTGGEELKSKPENFIRENSELWNVSAKCYNFHVFKNKKNKPKQVQELIKKILK